jgi:hypothetical protein
VLKDWEKRENLTLLNLKYDLTQYEFITMVKIKIPFRFILDCLRIGEDSSYIGASGDKGV